MSRKTTQKRRLNKNRRGKQHGRKTRGGAGASDYMIQAAGNMGEQVGHNGVLTYRLPQMGGGSSPAIQAAGLADALNRQSGGVGASMAVPVVLMLANQVAPKMLRGLRGGAEPVVDAAATDSIATDSIATDSTADVGSIVDSTVDVDSTGNVHTDPSQSDEEEPESADKVRGGMLGTIAVPAALVLASNYFGKRSRRAAPKQNRYTRK